MLSMKRSLTWRAAVAILVMVSAVSGCAQPGVAFGDSQGSNTVVDHDQIDRSDVLLGIVGSTNRDEDRAILQALADAKLKAVYVSTAASGGDQGTSARQGVEDLAVRGVNGIMIMALDVDVASESSWNTALGSARNAGVPVILVNPGRTPSDTALYAAKMYTNRRDQHRTAIDAAVLSIINNDGHGRIIDVSNMEAAR